MKETMIGISYGLLFDPIEEQLNKQGYTLGKEAEKYEESRKAIFQLMFNDIATGSQSNSMFKKLHNKVMKNIKPLEVEE